MYRGTEVKVTDFSGGLVTNRPITELSLSQAADLDNIIIFPQGRGFRSRYGDTELNSTAFNSGASMHGLGYLKLDNTNEYLVCVAGTKVGATGAGITGTISDITGAVTVTTGSDNIWSFATFNNKIVAFGGPPTGPDAPFVWTATGNVSALGGSPPSAHYVFQANNRLFAMRTSANPSRIYWSILGNEADWTGTGSGSADVWTSDNDCLVTAAVLSTNTVLLFKQNSIHQMQIGSLVDGAFPIFPAFDGIGCAGKHACVVADGLAYFITSQAKMKVTDGAQIIEEADLPNLNSIDDQWQATNVTRLQHIQGIRKTGIDYDHIIWFVDYGSGQTSKNRVFIWDLLNKCWLQNTSGYSSNVAVTTQDGTLYGGHTNGKIYKKDSSTSTYTDASNTSAVVDAYWTSGWVNNEKYEKIKQPRKLNLSFSTQTLGALRIFYGFDFNAFSRQVTVSQITPNSATYDNAAAIYDSSLYATLGLTMRPIPLVGRGNFFQFKIASPTASISMKINGLSLSGKEYGQKEIVSR